MSNTSSDALSASTSSFVTSLVTNIAVAGGELVAFIIFRRWIKAIYEPRTYIPPKASQAPVLGKHTFEPLWRIIMADPEEILHKNGVDPYVFIRFLMMMTKAMIPIWLISWAVLLPVDSANSKNGDKDGLDRFTFGNVAKDKQSRYWAHLILDYVFIFWFMWLIWGEMQHWLVIRQRHLINPSHSKLAQANTVLVTGIPKHFLDEDKLEQLFRHLPGGVKRIWLNRNLKDMPNLHDRRVFATNKLESAQVDLIKFARKWKIKREGKIEKLETKKKPIPSTLTGPNNPQLLQNEDRQNASALTGPSRIVHPDPETGDDREPPFPAVDELGRADQLVPRNKRPTYRIKPKWAPFGLGFLGIGQKVDAIDWARKEIAFTSTELKKSRKQLQDDIDSPGTTDDHYPPLNSAFIHFNQQIAAHMAAQCLTHSQPYTMAARYTEQSPANVIWRNLSLNPYEQKVRQALSWAATVGLIIAWATPVAFVGVLSNIKTLTDQFTWLQWINGDSTGKHILQGVISGVLPPVLLAVLMAILPFILRQLIAFEGIPSKTGVELSLMTRYFLFLVIHTFIVVTLTSGLVRSAQEFINNPGSIATTLASQMPTASTFFITLVLTQFTGTMGTLLQIISLVLYYVKIILFGGSPRSVYKSRYSLNTQRWGTDFPAVTVYAVIMIAYCIISPIINGFGAAFFLFAYLVYKYLFIWAYDQPPETDTGGLFFPKAITHLFVGMYIQEVCMAALFFLARDTDKKAKAIPQGALMIVLIVCTIAFHFTLLNSYGPLLNSLPLSLAHLSYGMPTEKGHEQSIIGQEYADNDNNNFSNPNAINDPGFNSSKERLTIGAAGPGLGTNDITPSSSNNHSHTGYSDEKAKTAEDREREQDLQNRMEEEHPTERDFAYATNGDDVELGIRTNLPRPNFQEDENISSPTAPGPPITTMPSHNSSANGRPNSLRSRKSTRSTDTSETVYFALPGGPGVMKSRQKFYDDDGNDPKAFFHPATKEQQRIIWLPDDELGLCKAEIERNEKEGVRSSSKGAWLNDKGKVQITGPPPDDI
ncbi:uncharacterized protein I206_103591 [Kwoniella pini CBS 10737]|uniref:DUF221-domain-containing protein n=1 Tax=Kwoniella pini CBS 10737 TaxID=1296096 RepID=A0A1B9I9Q6_9TREE|nr:uncharacterized protein I206_01406 [Kwoniella pini CBS 10737]OCF52121.1 hypothetical protein I206_01406 [Kwoniella pini CBS 10737]